MKQLPWYAELDTFNMASPAAFLAVFIILLSSFVRGYLLIFASILAASLFIISLYLELFLAKKKRAIKTTKSVLRALHAIKTGMHISKLPLTACITHAILSSDDRDLSSALASIRNRMKFGQDFHEAVRSIIFSGEAIAAVFRSLAEAYERNMDMYIAVKHVYDATLKKRLAEIEKAYASVQKYSSISMVAGTIIPSFMLFAFIGYSIISGGSVQLFIFALLFGAVLPSIFSAVRALQAGLYED
jgi:hypothetical protein